MAEIRRDEVKVLGWWPSPFLFRPRVALGLKGVAYEFLPETIGSKSKLLLDSNPIYKRIPVLIHNGRPLCESMIIVRYIDDVWADSGPAILPSDPYDCATACFWAFYVDDKLSPALRASGMAPTEAEKVEASEQVIVGLQLLEGVFSKCSAEGKLPFFGGENIGYLDIAFGSCLGWVRATEQMSGFKFLDEGTTPLLTEWAERFCAHPTVKEVMPETDKLIKFATEVLAGSIAGISSAK